MPDFCGGLWAKGCSLEPISGNKWDSRIFFIEVMENPIFPQKRKDKLIGPLFQENSPKY
jgi:hypothetical protein